MKYLGTYDFGSMTSEDKQDFLDGFEDASGKTVTTNYWPFRLRDEGVSRALIDSRLEDRFGFAYAAGHGRGVTEKLMKTSSGKGGTFKKSTVPKESLRNPRIVTVNGRTMSARDWDRHKGFPLGTVYQRIKNLGWTPSKAVNTPIQYKPKKRTP